MKNCKGCGEDKTFDEFYFIKKKQIYTSKCKECLRAAQRVCNLTNEQRKNKNFRQRKENISTESYLKKLEITKKWKKTNKVKKKVLTIEQKEKRREYDRVRNKSLIRKKYQNNKESLKYKNNIYFKLRKIISKSVSGALKNNYSSKYNKSILKYLPYTIMDLKIHLESLFEPWMNWNNHGVYNINTWDDSDSSTWTWQIDHIEPHKNFKYLDMECDEFKKCWSLNNLRPLSSKQNNIDSCYRSKEEIDNIKSILLYKSE